MRDATGGLGGDAARRVVLRQDRQALTEIVHQRSTCEATGERLSVQDAVAMMVTAGSGIGRLALVSAAHWESGQGALSAGDPDVDPDVLDGRRLFARERTAAPSGARLHPPERRAPRRVRRPRPQLPGSTWALSRL